LAERGDGRFGVERTGQWLLVSGASGVGPDGAGLTVVEWRR
jgi:hypothetical protein